MRGTRGGQYFWKGKRVDLGSNAGYCLIYYNTAVFKEIGIPDPSDDWAKPWTWAEFAVVLKRVTTRTATGDAYRYGFTDLAEHHRIRQATDRILAKHQRAIK